MLSNAYFLAKFRFGTAENEPAKNLQIFRKMHFFVRPGKKPAGDALAAPASPGSPASSVSPGGAADGPHDLQQQPGAAFGRTLS